MKSYNQFIKESKNSIESICKQYGIKNYIINEDGSIDITGNVFLEHGGGFVGGLTYPNFSINLSK